MQGLGIITPTHSLNLGSGSLEIEEKERGGKGRYQKCALSDHVSIINDLIDVISNPDLACGRLFDLLDL